MMDQISHDAGAASDDDPNSPRGGSRDSLLLSARMRLPVESAPANVRVRNLSPGGLMAEFAGRVSVGDPVAIDVRGIGWVDGRVAWIAEGRLGIAFNEPIDPLLARKPVPVTPTPKTALKKVRSLL